MDGSVAGQYTAWPQDADEPVFDLAAASSVPGSVVPRFGAAFSPMNLPVALVLDDVHLLRNAECRAALSVLADHVPAGSRLVLANWTCWKGESWLNPVRGMATGF